MENLVIVLCCIISGLIIVILVLTDKIVDLKKGKSLYEDLYNHKINDCDDLKYKIDEYDKIFENIKSLMPF